MIDLNKLVLQDFPCDDCNMRFSDHKQFVLHRKHHNSFFRTVITEEILLEEDCPLCLVKYSRKYKDTCLKELLGSGTTRELSMQRFKRRQIMRCKYYPKSDAQFWYSTEFIKHSKEPHKNDRSFACPQCGYTTQLYTGFRKHLSVFKCFQCGKEYRSGQGQNNHLLANHEEEYNSKEGLASHSSSHRFGNIKSYDRSTCDKKFSPPCKLENHLRSHLHTTETIKCPLCPKKYYSQVYFKRHLETHGRMYGCYRCSKEYKTKAGLNSHLISSHKEVDINSHDCPHCDKRFYAPNVLEKHMKTHSHASATLKSEHRMFKCHLCPKYYKSKESLNGHLLFSHKGVDCDVMSYACPSCDKKYTTRYRLEKHKKTHSLPLKSSKPEPTARPKFQPEMWKCSLCPKELRSRAGLYLKMFSCHKDVQIKPFVCSYCGKKFHAHSVFEMHLQTHPTAPGISKCRLCSKEYSSEAYFEKHIKAHDRAFRYHLFLKHCATEADLERHLLSS